MDRIGTYAFAPVRMSSGHYSNHQFRVLYINRTKHSSRNKKRSTTNIFREQTFIVPFCLVRDQIERKFQRKKQVVPGEHDVKIYMRMAVLAGFGWTIGFILFVLPEGEDGFERYLSATFKYLFILLNSTPGLFIFVVYVCNRRVFNLYFQLLGRIYNFLRDEFQSMKNINFQFHSNYLFHVKNRLHRVTHHFCRKRRDQITITSSLSTITDVIESNNMIQMSPVDVKRSPDGNALSASMGEVPFQ